MGRSNRAQEAVVEGPVIPPQIPLGELKELEPQFRLALCEGLNYMRAHAPNPIVDDAALVPAVNVPEGE